MLYSMITSVLKCYSMSTVRQWGGVGHNQSKDEHTAATVVCMMLLSILVPSLHCSAFNKGKGALSMRVSGGATVLLETFVPFPQGETTIIKERCATSL